MPIYSVRDNFNFQIVHQGTYEDCLEWVGTNYDFYTIEFAYNTEDYDEFY